MYSYEDRSRSFTPTVVPIPSGADGQHLGGCVAPRGAVSVLGGLSKATF